MTTILPSDTIFATVRQRGTTLADIRLSGISSIRDILIYLRRTLGTIAGLATIDLRNGSQGWQQRHTVMLAPVIRDSASQG
ncbi:MAG: hypothetical protein K2M94_07395 [Paramuribaculum sp.]|nr:hypothetical protein [Paramuribaculum sp.]